MVTLAVDKHGTVLIRDGGRAIIRYGHDGQFLGDFGLGSAGGPPDLIPATDGSIYLRGGFPRGAPPDPSFVPAMLHYDTAGHLLDSIAGVKPWMKNDPDATMYSPQQAWFVLPDKRIYHARSDKLAFLLMDPAGGAPPLIGEIVTDSVKYLPEERAELQAQADFQSANSPAELRRPSVTIPAYKLPMRGTLTDIDGRIWLFRRTTSQKVEPRVGAIASSKRFMVTYAEPPSLVAFQTDGTFLGEVRFPMGVFIPVFVGNTAWAMVPDSNDVPMLVKFRLHD
jgi:hypothetical protein